MITVRSFGADYSFAFHSVTMHQWSFGLCLLLRLRLLCREVADVAMRTLRQLAAKHLQMFHSQFGNAINLLADFHWRLHHAFQPLVPLPAGIATLHDVNIALCQMHT